MQKQNMTRVLTTPFAQMLEKKASANSVLENLVGTQIANQALPFKFNDTDSPRRKQIDVLKDQLLNQLHPNITGPKSELPRQGEYATPPNTPTHSSKNFGQKDDCRPDTIA